MADLEITEISQQQRDIVLSLPEGHFRSNGR